MRFVLTTLAITLLYASTYAQTFEVDTILRNGTINDRINLVFLGDGYTSTQQDKFVTDVNEILDEMFSTSPFKEYKSYFNAYAIKVISAQSGANHPKTSPDPDCTFPVAVVDNYFGSTFDYNNIHRLLYPTQLSKVFNILATHFPLYDQAFVAVNSPHYGGAGGSVATCSDHPSGRDVAMHEIGHSFAGLADEYWAGAGFAAERPNMTKQTDPALVKWKNWMGVSGVGIYSHSGDATWKKPHTSCKMGVLGAPLCKVCSETFVERFHQFVRPVSSFLPGEERIQLDPEPTGDLDFSVAVVKPNPNTLKIVWEKDDVEVAKNVETVTISLTDILDRTTVRVTVFDTIALTRAENHVSHMDVIEWELSTGSITGTEYQSQASRYNLSVFPNPSDSDLKFSYTLSKPVNVAVKLLDTNGGNVRNLVDEIQETGEHQYVLAKKDLNVTSATYILQFTFGKTNIPIKVVLH